ncbi:Nucleosome assembly protein 1-like 1 [Entomophthora muscae]|uniref:Nucleosome assembly protein 1-like 1 n=2 Tax=Entomophthora muscae TaxID=34485 RepID=A0ACC2SA46_9FUNG|nr:Nucleosome assembly protein 1-like 1 [Entomophthora muscae]
MTEIFEDPLLAPQLAEQKAKLEPFIEELKVFDSELNDEIARQENLHRLKVLPIFNSQREIFKTIPHFWLYVFFNSFYYGEFFTGHDKKALQSLTDVELEYDPSNTSFYTLTFHFSHNEYFSNRKLKFQTVDNPDQRVKLTTINWHSPKKNIIELDESHGVKSFFNFFVSGDDEDFGEVFINDTMPYLFELYNGDATNGFFGKMKPYSSKSKKNGSDSDEEDNDDSDDDNDDDESSEEDYKTDD